MKKCVSCGEKIHELSTDCQFCGSVQDKAKLKTRKIKKILTIFLLSLALAGVVVGGYVGIRGTIEKQNQENLAAEQKKAALESYKKLLQQESKTSASTSQGQQPTTTVALSPLSVIDFSCGYKLQPRPPQATISNPNNQDQYATVTFAWYDDAGTVVGTATNSGLVVANSNSVIATEIPETVGMWYPNCKVIDLTIVGHD